MGLQDNDYLLSDEQAVGATAISTVVPDMGPLTAGNTGVNLGALADLWIRIVVRGTVASGGGSATVTFTVETDDNVGLSSAATALTTAAIAQATLVDNYVVMSQALPDFAWQQFVGVRYTVASGPLTGDSAFSAYIGTQPFVMKQHPNDLDFE